MNAICSYFKLKYEPQYYLLGYFIDAAIPKLKVCIEYDGHQRHYYKHRNDDFIKDKKIIEHGWRILRISRNHIFSQNIGNEICDFIYSGEVRLCLGKEYKEYQ